MLNPIGRKTCHYTLLKRPPTLPSRRLAFSGYLMAMCIQQHQCPRLSGFPFGIHASRSVHQDIVLKLLCAVSFPCCIVSQRVVMLYNRLEPNAAMTDSSQPSDNSSVKDRLKKLLDEISVFIDDASEQDHQRLLNTLKESAQGERRKHTRKACSIKVTLDEVFKNLISDISAGGVFIKTSAPLCYGEEVTLVFSLPNQNIPVEITGNVVRVSSEGVGVEFKKPLDSDMKKTVESL